MHSLIIGTTESGKTYLSKLQVQGLARRGQHVAVLDSFADPQWDQFGAEFVTSDGGAFLNHVKRVKDNFLFVDESATTIGRYNPEMDWLATSSRHLGHACTFILHRSTQISPVIRTNCRRLFLFAADANTAKDMALEFREPKLTEISNLRKGEFFIVDRFPSGEKTEKIFRGTIDFAEGIVYSVSIESDNDDTKREPNKEAEHDPDKKSEVDSAGVGDA